MSVCHSYREHGLQSLIPSLMCPCVLGLFQNMTSLPHTHSGKPSSFFFSFSPDPMSPWMVGFLVTKQQYLAPIFYPPTTCHLLYPCPPFPIPQPHKVRPGVCSHSPWRVSFSWPWHGPEQWGKRRQRSFLWNVLSQPWPQFTISLRSWSYSRTSYPPLIMKCNVPKSKAIFQCH